MRELTKDELVHLSQMYAFLGNSLLKPMNQTKGPGLDPAFWAALPDFDDPAVEAALDSLLAFAEDAAVRVGAGEDPATEVAVEHTRLFVGPPSPAAAPWETYYPEIPEGMAPEDVPEPSCGFGEPTFAMRELLRKAGLGLTSENHQFEDHMGIELLYLSVLCGKAAEVDGGKARADVLAQAEVFIAEHPARWIDRLMAKVETAAPKGYVIHLLRLAKTLMAL
ncbi:MAG: molecular chaperone TorD family protein [Eggerthellaceae bacterium]|nr:molecular chaperone TorD family protein [Eggerthellaceae bacterium]